MSALDFPSNPSVGQVFGRWVWDGTRWVSAGSGAGADTRPRLSRFNAPFTVLVPNVLICTVQWRAETEPEPWPVLASLNDAGGSTFSGIVSPMRRQGGFWVADILASFSDMSPVSARELTCRFVEFDETTGRLV